MKMSNPSKLYHYHGEMLTIKEISKETGIAETTLRYRIWLGVKEAELVKPPLSKSECGKLCHNHYRRRPVMKKEQEEPEGMTYAEIAEELGVSRKYVYMLEKRALTKIRRALGIRQVSDDDSATA